MSYLDLSLPELKDALTQVTDEYDAFCALDLKLNMARGKPSREQIALSLPLLDTLTSQSDLYAQDGTDCANYGVMDGIVEAKQLMGAMMQQDPNLVCVCGNASLNIMYDLVNMGAMRGFNGHTPWNKLDHVRWLCPVPGYDRHFSIIEAFGFEMIPIPLNESGPDMDMVEELVSHDASIKGIWCVPQYSNPSGVTYSDETVSRLASMPCAAPDFKIFWDNAYCVHHLSDDVQDHVADIAQACALAHTDTRYLKFASTSKITLPGAGIAAVGACKENIDAIRKHLSVQTVGYDKINQLRHVRFLRDLDGITEQMHKHALIIKPKFDAVDAILTNELTGTGIASWTHPHGGYFISFNGLDNTAKRTVELASHAGVVLTGAGATWPYKQDPHDNNIRIAPTLPPLEELEQAMHVFVCCVKRAALEELIAQKTQ